jgi:hypothetical protein
VLGFSFFGPWLLPALERKGIRGPAQQDCVNNLIHRYNSMLAGLDRRFLYVDLRSEIRPADWRDELHLTNSAFRRVAARIAETIRQLS